MAFHALSSPSSDPPLLGLTSSESQLDDDGEVSNANLMQVPWVKTSLGWMGGGAASVRFWWSLGEGLMEVSEVAWTSGELGFGWV